MNKTLKVQGMHCEACKMLVRMEIEDLGLEENVEDISLEEDKTGNITLVDIDEESIEKIRQAVNKMDQYEVLEREHER